MIQWYIHIYHNKLDGFLYIVRLYYTYDINILYSIYNKATIQTIYINYS